MSVPADLSPRKESKPEKTGVIYRIYHKKSMKSYIGKTVNPEKRIRYHLNGYGKSPVLFHAIRKYGKDAFGVEILESNVPEPILSKLEILHIRFFNCKAPNGYNLTDGGEGARGTKPSRETRQKMSASLKGRIGSMRGKSHSLETRRKISQAQKAQKNHLYGKKHSPEARR